MWCAWARNTHATVHPSPIFSDTRSVQLVPEQTLERVASAMEGFSQEAADALNARYLAGRRDRLRLQTIERLLTAIC
jgi:hypothetical protein